MIYLRMVINYQLDFIKILTEFNLDVNTINLEDMVYVIYLTLIYYKVLLNIWLGLVRKLFYWLISLSSYISIRYINKVMNSKIQKIKRKKLS